MYTMLRDSNPTAAKISLDVMIELYRRNIWWVWQACVHLPLTVGHTGVLCGT